MANSNNIANQLNDLLVTRDFHPEMLDKNGQPAAAEDAKTFSFDYVSGAGKNYGTMVIVLGNDNEMQVMYGDNLGRTMEGSDKQEFFDFIQHLHKFATRNFWTYTPQDISRLKHVQAGIAAIQEGLFEGYYGTRKVSYAGEPTDARLQIVHNRPLGEGDARFRHIAKIFIETAEGEKFKLGFTNLAGARAMLEHVRQGGRPYDIRGNHITEMVNEIKLLSRFNRASQGRVVEGVTDAIITEAQKYYKSLRENLKHLGSSRGYQNYFESWTPMEISEQDKLVEDIKTLFVEQTIDARIEEALPILARIQGTAMKEVEIFESWIDSMVEGTWALPETPEQENKLKELMSKELIAGPDGTNATEQLYDIVGDDHLFDLISAVAAEDPNANIWDNVEIQNRLRELGIEMPQPQAEPEQQPTPVNEGRIIDESGETLQHILDRFKHEVKSFEEGGDLDDDLYDALYDYYSNNGEMPYGTMKARTGDPYEWITDRLDQELGTGNHAPRLPEGDNFATFVEGGMCNQTMEGEYCPEHGLAECGYMETTTSGGVAPVVMGEMDKPKHDDAINYNAAMTSSYYESKNDELNRLKKLALGK